MQGPQKETLRNFKASHAAVQRAPRPAPITVPLSDTHRVDLFECPRSAEIEKFIRQDARRFVETRCGEVFVLPDEQDPTKILGFYNLAASSLVRSETSNRTQKSVPSGIPIPVFIIGYLARDHRAERSIGAQLVLDAAVRGLEYGNISWGLVLYAANRRLVQYYADLSFYPARSTAARLQQEEAPEEQVAYYMYAHFEDVLAAMG